MIRQITDRYNQLTTELDNSSRRSIEMVDVSLNSLREKVGLIDQTVQDNSSLLSSGS